MQHYTEAWSKYAVFSGRSTRKDYWMFALINFIICVLLGVQSAVMNSAILYNIYVIAVFIPSLAIAVRRMHDTNRSGWWILAPLISLIFLCEYSTPGNNRYN